MSEVTVRAYKVRANLGELLVAPDGEVVSKSGNFVIDAEAFEEILKAFNEHGADLPIDYEHQTLGGKYSAPDGKAPAAGWIKSLSYEKGKGIIASVEWTERAKLMIESGEYGYMSPVVLVRKKDRKAVGLHSVALTNKPAIARLERLVAKEMGIMPKTKDKTVHQEGEIGMGDPMLALARIAEALGLSDVPNDASAIAEAVLAEIRKMKSGEGEGEGGEEAAAAKEGIAKIAKRVGVKADAGVETIVAKIDEIRSTTVKKDDYEEIKASLKSLQDRETERLVNAEIDKAVSAGKLNKNDGDSIEYWRTVCAENVEHFRKLMEKAPRVWAGEGVESGGDKAKPADQRQKLIQDHAAQWRANRDQHGMEQTSMEEFVSGCLMYDGHSGLTKAERETLTAKETK